MYKKSERNHDLITYKFVKEKTNSSAVESSLCMIHSKYNAGVLFWGNEIFATLPLQKQVWLKLWPVARSIFLKFSLFVHWSINFNLIWKLRHLFLVNTYVCFFDLMIWGLGTLDHLPGPKLHHFLHVLVKYLLQFDQFFSFFCSILLKIG